MNWNADYISWKTTPTTTTSSKPSSGADRRDDRRASFLAACMSPRPTAWMSVYPPPPPPSASDGGGEYDYHDGHELEPLVALVEGYCGASDRPPTLMLGSDSIPPEVLAGLRANGVCSLSVSTEREMRQARRMCRPLRGGAARCGPAATFGGAGLRPRPPPSVLSDLPAPVRVGVGGGGGGGGGASSNRPRRPPAVDDSPVHMHCRLVSDVPLPTGEDGDEDVRADDSHPPPSMLLLQVDTYVIGGDVIWTRQQSSLAPGRTSIHGNPDLRDVAGKIDCLLLKPLASLGGGRFGRVGCIYHMGRPRPTPSKVDLNADTCGDVGWESNSMWEIDQLVPVESIYSICFSSRGNGETIEYSYRLDPRCALGYNPMKQVVCPRFVGWISTYEPDSLLPPGDDDSDIDRTTTTTLRRRRRTKTGPIPHISPYSFFVDVARGPRPMVAFAACPRSDEFGDSDDDDDDITGNADDVNDGHHHHHHHDGGARWKDAQRDAERTGYFCVNVVSDGLAWAMNASAAPLGRGLSEFRLAAGGGCPIRASDDGAVLCENERIVPSPLPAPAVDAPFVSQSPSFMECRYVKTVKVPEIFENDSMYSLIIGEVINIHIRKDCLEPKITGTVKDDDDGSCGNEDLFDLAIDLEKVRPVSRLGYSQEYTVILEDVPHRLT